MYFPNILGPTSDNETQMLGPIRRNVFLFNVRPVTIGFSVRKMHRKIGMIEGCNLCGGVCDLRSSSSEGISQQCFYITSFCGQIRKKEMV